MASLCMDLLEIQPFRELICLGYFSPDPEVGHWKCWNTYAYSEFVDSARLYCRPSVNSVEWEDKLLV